MTPEPLTLFSAPRVYTGRSRRDDPDTSLAAARSVGHGAEQAILDVFRAEPRYMGGFTADELEARLLLVRRDTLRSALSRLGKRGALEDSGARRDSTAGRPQIVWVLAKENP